MEDLFVPYEIALEMKLLGFDKECITTYTPNHLGNLLANPFNIDLQEFKELQKPFHLYDLPKSAWYKNSELSVIAAPTFAQCFKFFREKYNLHIVISWRDDLSNYDVSLIEMKKSGYFYYKENLKSYEEAELACVTELINIVKKKKP